MTATARSNLLSRVSVALGAPKPKRTVRAKSVLSDNEELIKGVQLSPEALAAAERVAAAEQKVKDIRARQRELEAAMVTAALEQEQNLRNVERDANAKIAEAEVIAAEKLLKAAELQAKIVAAEKQEILAGLIQDAERKESGKAATAAVVGGLFGALPLAFASPDEGLVTFASLGGSLATCALFGVVYRYIVRDESRNAHLMGGAVAAFGLARGLALAEGTLRAAEAVDVTVLLQAALAAGQSMLVVGFAAAALEAAIGQGLIARFGAAAAETEEK